MPSRQDIDDVLKNMEALKLVGEDDVLDYLGSVVDDVSDWSTPQPLTEALADMLLGYGVADTEEGAASICQEIHAKLKVGAPADAPKQEFKKLEQAVNLKAKVEEQTEQRRTIVERSEGLAGTNMRQGAFLVNKEVDRTDDLMKSAGFQKSQAKKAKMRDMAYTWSTDEGHHDIMEGFKIYLEARRHGGGKDVNVQGLNMLTPDNRVLLDNSALRLPAGRRFGLIGQNGIGKTTLLRRLSSYSIDGFPKHLKVLHVEQEVTGDHKSVLQTVLDADLERAYLLAQEKELNERLESGKNTAQDTEEYAYVQSRLLEMEAWSAEARASTILSGLNVTQEMQQGPTKALSGGWRMRVALAAALFVKPDMLLLDEPTNHLDFPTVMWLQDYLKTYDSTMIIVSHDRGFLDSVVTDIVLFKNKTLAYYKGSYSSFVKTQKEQYIAQKRAYEAQQMQIKHIEDFITTFYAEKRSSAQDSKTKLVESRKKVLEKMERIEDPDVTDDAPPIEFFFPDPMGALKKDLIAQTEGLSFAYPDRPQLLRNVTVQVHSKSRIGMLGANGSGKSTLIKCLMGTLQPTAGQITLNANSRTALFAQHHVDALDLTLTPVECLRASYPEMEVKEVRRYLGRFGITDNMQLMQMGYLSGGQKSRIAFALIVYQAPNLVVMDEPTNHLDMETIDALIKAIHKFNGAVLLVSHDQYFLEQVVSTYWSVGNGEVAIFDSLDAAKKFSYVSKT